MKQITLTVEESLYNFYKKVGQQAGGLHRKRSCRMLFSNWRGVGIECTHKIKRGVALEYTQHLPPSEEGGSFLCVC